MRNNGNGPGENNNHGKPHLFKSLDNTSTEQNSLLGMHSSTSVSRVHQSSRLGAQVVDIFLSLYILVAQLPPTAIGRMNHTGMFTAIMTALLLLTVCGSLFRSSSGTNYTWMATRIMYYLAGILVSTYYLNYLGRGSSSNQQHLSSLGWNNFVPLVFCVFGLLQSLFVWRTSPRADGYAPHIEEDGLAFKEGL